MQKKGKKLFKLKKKIGSVAHDKTLFQTLRPIKTYYECEDE